MFKTKYFTFIVLIFSNFIFSGCVAHQDTFSNNYSYGPRVNVSLSAFAYPYYFNRPFYYLDGIYYYGGFYRDGFYHYGNRRFRRGHYYHNGNRYYRGRRYRARNGVYGYYKNRNQYIRSRGVRAQRGYVSNPNHARQRGYYYHTKNRKSNQSIRPQANHTNRVFQRPVSAHSGYRTRSSTVRMSASRGGSRGIRMRSRPPR